MRARQDLIKIPSFINRERHYNPRVADALDKMEAMVGFLLFLANLSELSSTSVGYSASQIGLMRLKDCACKGYTDNDGWLTQLLVMKHGNISEVNQS